MKTGSTNITPASCDTMLIFSLSARVPSPTLYATLFLLAFTLVSALYTLASIYTTVLAALLVTVCPTAPLGLLADLTAMLQSHAFVATAVFLHSALQITTSCVGCTGRGVARAAVCASGCDKFSFGSGGPVRRATNGALVASAVHTALVDAANMVNRNHCADLDK